MKRKSIIISFIVVFICLAVFLVSYELPSGNIKENISYEEDSYVYEIDELAAGNMSLIRKLFDGFDEIKEENMVIADGWKSGDVFYSTWRKENVIFHDGYMQLQINKDMENGETPWSSAEYFTCDFAHYGKYEVRMKPIKSSGVISSFFVYTGEAYGTPWDEIDIEFLGNDTSSVQFNYYADGVGNHEYKYKLGFDASNEYHTYGFEWQKDYIIWLVDGQEVYRSQGNIPSNPGKIMMNTWIGQGVDGWAGTFNGQVPLTAEYDWIRYEASF